MTSASNLAIFATSVTASSANPAFNGNVSVTGNIVVSNNIAIGATFSTLGAPINGAIIQGNVGIGTSGIVSGNVAAIYGGNLFVAGNIQISNTATQLGGIQFADGSFMATAAAGSIITNDTTTSAARYINFTSTTSGTASTLYTSNPGLLYYPLTGNLLIGGNITAGSTAFGNVSITNTTAATSSTTGALTVAGGIGVGGNAYIAGNVNLTNPLTVTNGGTGLSTIPTNGQILIGNGTGFTRATLTAGAGISVTNGSGSVTITASVSPSFVYFLSAH